ncbi:MAG: bifunctional diaminohydroxyphosphoribosylaminopyrimidine deaminase/5-amino-6-(5-phosphoribosylamino)uracil reductase RibD, partial [Cytophagales bacterium]|nr:bifunctional diaminohydroxyphosphoribosylaminopyrimidine deaminase/5-amino-6-(5-phosphoribosylamino)uracil reductase RibD [Cytophagales bacterium]
PCSHFGKTPPCADLLIEKKIGRVICSNSDPNPLVSGSGFAKLRNAGIEVIENVLSNKGRWLNRRFFTLQEKKRPYLILKWAETADGFVAREDFSSKWISHEISRTLVHKWRTEESAIMVGYRTVWHDNPSLTARDWPGQNPIRCLIDRNCSIPSTAHVLNNEVRTLVFNHLTNKIENQTEWIKLPFDEPTVPLLVKKLGEMNISSVIIEGGSQTLRTFFESGIWDEARVFKSQTIFGKGIIAPQPKGKLISREYIAGNELSFYVNSNV